MSWESAPDADGLTESRAGDVIAWDYAVGIACAGVQTALSEFGSIYFEMMLQARGRTYCRGRRYGFRGRRGRGPETFSVWDRNIQLAMYSIAIYLPMAFLDVGGANILEGGRRLCGGSRASTRPAASSSRCPCCTAPASRRRLRCARVWCSPP